MARFDQYTNISVLLAKALQGRLTVKEQQELEAWRLENKANDRLYHQVSDPSFVKNKWEQRKMLDVAAAYLKTRESCAARTRKRILHRLSTVAAVVLLGIGIGVYWFMISGTDEQGKREMAEKRIVPGGVKAELILAEGGRVILDGRMADSVLLQAGIEVHTSGNTLNYVANGPMTKFQYNTLKVPRGGEYSITLQDGTVVYLNSVSELRYPVCFAGNERRVFLCGEAYFDVVKDTTRPFVVETGSSEIEVLGTSFNVCSYDREGIQTTLVEGAVRFSIGKQTVVLAPGEQGVLSVSGQLEKRKVDVYPYVAWKEGKFVFRKQPLEQVMRTIARWYDVEVFFADEAVKSILFSGNVQRYDDFNRLVGMLEMTGGLLFRIEGRRIYITMDK